MERLQGKQILSHPSEVIWNYILVRQIMFRHTFLNKITGLLLYLLPLSLPFAEIKYTASIVSAVAFLSAMQEIKEVALMTIKRYLDKLQVEL